MSTITTKRGHVVVIDDDKAPMLSAYTWEFFDRYRRLSLEAHDPATRRKVQMHRLLVNASAGQIVDHINGNFLDNRLKNSRICDAGQNARNRQANLAKKTPYKGVAETRGGKFKAYIYLNRRYNNLGTFSDVACAARAYDDAAREHFGDFCCVNFPKSGERCAVRHMGGVAA